MEEEARIPIGPGMGLGIGRTLGGGLGPGAVLGGATTFAELRETEEATESAWKVRDLTWQFQDLVGNIMASDVEDKTMAVQSLTGEFIQELDKLPESKSLWDRVKALWKPKSVEKPFTIWKDGDTWRWAAVYSNKFRDRDKPPEILAEAAHKEFIAAVDAGEWDYPELQLWHTEGTRFGITELLAYDDTGFSVASGTVDKGKEHIAEALAEDENLAVSHGMPRKEIEYDEKDPSVIVRYRTAEISALPQDAAANELTGFIMEDKMGLEETKKDWLRDKLGDSGLEELEALIGDKAKDADGMEYKEEADEEVDEEETPEEDPPRYATVDEVAEAVGQSLSGLQDQMDTLLTAVTANASAVKAIAGVVATLQQTDEEKIAEMKEDTPAASLYDMISSVIGARETKVDGRTKLANDGPKESQKAMTTSIPVVNELVTDGDWRKALEA